LLITALAVTVAGGAGVALGLSGLVSAPSIPAGIAPVDARTTPAASCAGGPTVASLDSGDRVVAVARSDDGDWIGVRSASSPRTLWVSLAVVSPDDGEPELGALPTGGVCPEVVVVAAAPPVVDPSSEPTDEPEPGPDPDPGPDADTTAPTLGSPSVTPSTIGCAPGIVNPDVSTTTISVSASDDRGVASVRISWSGAESGSAQMSQSGSTWSYTYNPSDSTSGVVTFSIQATDTSSNLSAPRGASVTVLCLD
jgi:hypothetical protein